MTKHIIKLVGGALVIGGLMANPLFLEAFIGSNGRIENVLVFWIIFIFEAVLVATGLYAFLRPAEIVRKRNELILAGIVSILSLGFAEGAMRVVWKEPAAGWYGYPPGLYLPDEEIGYRLKPGFTGKFPNPPYDKITIEVNSLGLRDDEHSYERTAGTKRILGLGDSVTFGSGVPHEATYLEQLERELNKKPPNGESQVEVINTAVNGYDFDHEYAFWRTEGYKYHPDLVVLGVVLNDIKELTPLRLKETYETHRALQEKESLGDSAVPTTLREKITRICTLCRAGRAVVRSLRKEREEYNTRYFNILMNREWSRNWDVFQTKLARFRDELDKEGVRLAVVVFPQTEQFRYAEGLALVPQERLKEFGKLHNVPVIDLTPHLDVANYKEYYLGGDSMHLNVEGHALVATILRDALAENGLIKP